jgi:hypothetical protein
MALILAPVEYSLRAVLGIVKAVEVTGGGRIGRVKLGATKSSSLSSESDGILY